MWSVTASVRVGHWGRVGQVLIETLPGTPEGPKHRSGGHWNKEHSQWIWHCPDTVCWWQGRSYRLSERIRALSKLSDIMCKFMHVWHPPSCHTHSHKYSQSAQRPWIEKTHFLSPKIQGTLLFYIHTDNQAKPLQQRHFLKRLCIVYRWKESAIEKGRKNVAPKHKELSNSLLDWTWRLLLKDLNLRSWITCTESESLHSLNHPDRQFTLENWTEFSCRTIVWTSLKTTN